MAGQVWVRAWLVVVAISLAVPLVDDRLSWVSSAVAQDDSDDDGGEDGGGDGGDDGSDDEVGDGGDDAGGDDSGGGGQDDDASGDDAASTGPGSEGGLFAPLRRLVSPDDGAPGRRDTAVRTPPAAPPSLTAAAEAEVVASGLDPAARDALVAEGYRVIAERDGPGGLTLRLAVPPGLPVEAARAALQARPGVQADLNHFYRTEQAPVASVCEVDPCPARVQIGWPEIPARTGVCGEGVPLGMVDTGINDRHDTFRGASMDVTRLTPDGLDPATAVHGTAVAALFVGDPASRSPGLIPGARLVAVDAFHRDGTDERADVFALVAALDLLADKGVRVVNLSLAGPPNTVLADAITRLARDRDILFVAAAGNGGPAADPQYPAAYPDVLAVTAVDRRFEPWRRAARGEHVDLAAPGVDVWTAASIRGARTKTGTSFAAPFVSAAAALLRDRFPSLSAEEVRKALVAAATDLGPPGPDELYGAGLLSSAGLCG